MTHQTVTPARRRLYGVVHAGAKALGWDDDVYRSVLGRRYGVTTAKKLTDAQLRDLIEHMREQGFGRLRQGSGAPRPGPSPRTTGGGALAAKIRALWLALWNLGVVRDRGDLALARFVERQTGKEALRFLTAPEANAAIEALKKMAARDAGVRWDEHENPRVCVARAQWRRLEALGLVKATGAFGLDGWASRAVSPHATTVEQLAPDRLDEAIAKLGAWLRAKLKAGQQGKRDG